MKFASFAIMVTVCIMGCAAEDPSENEASPDSAVVTQAATNDGFTVTTSDGCGSIEYVDNGTLNGATNDDFVLVHDLCGDGHGVRGVVLVTDPTDGFLEFEGVIYNGNGLSGAPQGRDLSDVKMGDTIIMRVCLVDGEFDATPFNCRVGQHTSVDG